MKLFGRKKKKKEIQPEVRSIQCLYGPPEVLERRRRQMAGENVAEGIYGPPEMLEGRRRQRAEEDILPEDNVAEDVYGPPEMLGVLPGGDEEVIEEDDL